jgi:hypothetical protein
MSEMVNVPDYGLQFLFLLELIDEIGRDNLLELTTKQVCDTFILENTKEKKTSYCDMLLDIDDKTKAVDKANVFVSHAWSYQFLEVIEALSDHFGHAADSTYVWIDIFTVNQHTRHVKKPAEWWKDTFKNAIHRINHTVVVINPWDSPVVFQRAWCLWELYCSYNLQKLNIVMTRKAQEKYSSDLTRNSVDFNSVEIILRQIDCSKSECYDPTEQESIHEIIRTTVGFDKMDSLIFLKYRELMITVGSRASGSTRRTGSNPYNYREPYGPTKFPNAAETVPKLEVLHKVSSRDAELRVLLGKTESILDDLIEIARTYHQNGGLDNVCLRLLIVAAKTDAGSEYLSYQLKNLLPGWQRVRSTCWNRLVFELEETLKATELQKLDNAKLAAPINVEEETLESIEMAHNYCGLLLGRSGGLCTSALLKRRINALPSLHQRLPRDEFCGMFPKCCPGCIGLNLIVAAELLQDAEFVSKIFNELVGDKQGVILPVYLVQRLGYESRRSYNRDNGGNQYYVRDAYPYMGNCIDFGLGSPFVKQMEILGSLIESQNVRPAMEADAFAALSIIIPWQEASLRHTNSLDSAELDKMLARILHA